MAERKMDLSDKEVVEKYVNDEDIKANHRKIATLLEDKFRGNWFSIDQVVKKTRIKSIPEATQMMFGLSLFGLSTSKEHGGSVKFKITLDPKERIKVLQEHRENHIKQIEILDNEIAKLESVDAVQK